jgi:hypothetical protein
LVAALAASCKSFDVVVEQELFEEVEVVEEVVVAVVVVEAVRLMIAEAVHRVTMSV